MKKRILSLFTSLIMAISLVAVLPIMTVAAETSGDYEYNIIDDGHVKIVKYNGSATKVSIPSTIDGKKVTEIGEVAFFECLNLKSVTIPNTVRFIGEGAFFNCTGLTSITIPNSVTAMGEGTFFNCSNLTSVKFSNRLGTIPYAAFFNCVNLKSVSCPNSVINIEDYAFYGCKNLSSVKLSTYAESIGELAFGECPKLKSIFIPKSVNYIGNLAFGYIYEYYDKKQNVNYYDTLSDFKIKCYPNTSGEDYAYKNGFKYSYLSSLSAVKNFKASSTSSSAIKLTWSKLSLADGYIVYRYDTAKKKYVRIAKGRNLAFTDKKLSAGTTYKYAIRAYANIGGKEILSSSYPQITAVTNPANVAGFKAASTSASAIKLKWNKTSGADGYIVYRYNTATKKYGRIAKGKNLAFTDKNRTSGTAYKYAIRAYKNYKGKEILSSKYPEITATTNPANVSVFKAGSISENAIKLTWDKTAGADGYIVYRYNTVAKKYGRIAKGKNLAFTDKNLESGTTYKYAIRAYKIVNGKDLLSKSYPELTTSTNPATVSFTVTGGNQEATVKWDKVDGATGYKVYYKTSVDGKWIGLETTNNETTSYTKTDLESGNTYYFTVKAYRKINGKTYNGAYIAQSVDIVDPVTPPEQTVSYMLNADTMEVHTESCSTIQDPLNYEKTDDLNAALDSGYKKCDVCFGLN